MTELKALRSALIRVIGLECWAARTGGATGSHFDLDFGAKVPRVPLLKNPNLSEEHRRFTGEFGLYVYGAPWRVQSSTEVIGSWRDPGPSDGPMGRALKRLIGKRVTSAVVEPPALDLSIDFEDDLHLVVFSDGTVRMDDTDFTFFAPWGYFSIGLGGQLMFTPDPDQHNRTPVSTSSG